MFPRLRGFGPVGEQAEEEGSSKGRGESFSEVLRRLPWGGRFPKRAHLQLQQGLLWPPCAHPVGLGQQVLKPAHPATVGHQLLKPILGNPLVWGSWDGWSPSLTVLSAAFPAALGGQGSLPKAEMEPENGREKVNYWRNLLCPGSGWGEGGGTLAPGETTLPSPRIYFFSNQLY